MPLWEWLAASRDVGLLGVMYTYASVKLAYIVILLVTLNDSCHDAIINYCRCLCQLVLLPNSFRWQPDPCHKVVSICTLSYQICSHKLTAYIRWSLTKKPAGNFGHVVLISFPNTRDIAVKTSIAIIRSELIYGAEVSAIRRETWALGGNSNTNV